MEPGEYESIRLKNLEDNKRVLAAFGLTNPFKPVRCVINKPKRLPTKQVTTKKRPLPQEDLHLTGSLYGSRRKSARLSGQEAGAGLDLGSTYEELDEAEKKMKYTPVDRPKIYGPIDGVEVGTEWATRMECSRDGIHRPTVAGIHGGLDGAYSIALSGGYEDDVDLGDCFTYTGEGGRDLKGTKANPKNLRTAPQSKDQTLTRGNLALSRNVETGNPVRVIRGYKLQSHFAPEEGYRYDGIYTVEKCWFTTGLSGYGVWKFALKRCPDQASSPWRLVQECGSSNKSLASPLPTDDDALEKTDLEEAEALPAKHEKAPLFPLAEVQNHTDADMPAVDTGGEDLESAAAETALKGSNKLVEQGKKLSTPVVNPDTAVHSTSTNETTQASKVESEPVETSKDGMQDSLDKEPLPAESMAPDAKGKPSQTEPWPAEETSELQEKSAKVPLKAEQLQPKLNSVSSEDKTEERSSEPSNKISSNMEENPSNGEEDKAASDTNNNSAKVED